MFGFNRNLPAAVGTFKFGLLTVEKGGSSDKYFPIKIEPCHVEHEGVAFAQRELDSTYGQDFILTCISRPDLVGVTGNKHSEYTHQRMIVSFERCDPTIGSCLGEEEATAWLEGADMILFAPKVHPMMNEIPREDAKMEDSVVLFREYIKLAELKLSLTTIVKATLALKINEVRLSDGLFLPVLESMYTSKYL